MTKLISVSGGWLRGDFMMITDEKFKDVEGSFNRAYRDWKDNWPSDGKKYVWFEHHAEIVLGFKCQVDYSARIAFQFEVVDEQKYTMFLLRYS